MKIYLSASQQPNNIYADKVFTEEEVCHSYVNLLKPKLEAKGYEVKVSDPKKTMNDNIAEANAWMKKLPNGKYDGIYISHHTNAFDGKHDGTLGLYYPSAESRMLTMFLYGEIAPITKATDEGMREGKDLVELKKTRMIATLIEIVYHDNVADMKDFMLNMDKIADAEVRGIEQYRLWAKIKG
ncbi:MAG TPA: N-acetylmuramoyl-L-alanine amidase [Methanosarcinales archaeon]|nr:N-acetylmuramoyl-L-alanine amidase [Methanosarcinales archaeon]